MVTSERPVQNATMPRMRPILTLVLLVLVTVLTLDAAVQVGSVGAQPEGGARISGYGALTAGGGVARAAATVDHVTHVSQTAIGVRDDLGIAGRVTVTADAGRSGGASVVTGLAQATDLSLFDGRVRIASAQGRVQARADGSTARARMTAFQADGVFVDGVPVTVAAGAVVPVPGVGEVGFGEVGSDADGAVRLNLVRVSSEAQYAPPATFVIGHLDAAATAGPRAATAAPGADPRPVADPEVPRTPAARPSQPVTETPDAPDAVTRLPAPVVVPPATSTTPPSGTDPAPAGRLLPGTPAGGSAAGSRTFAFPVSGTVRFSDDYGLPRAGTGWHHGTDVFAAVGTPVVAVADGTLSRVGWNTLGGNRLWLTAADGTAYYYAHLSAYAPVAAEGAPVRAGDVIAYVGNTGQAATTPPHLHFEVHPGGAEAASVDPFALLQAWQAGAPTGATAAAAEAAPDAAAGAVVVGIVPERDAAPVEGSGAAVSAR